MLTLSKLIGLRRQLKKSGYPNIELTRSDYEALKQGCYFDAAKGWHVVDYIEYYCKLSIGQWKGKPIELLPWQTEQLLVPVFGWQRPGGLRRIKKSVTFIPKKNGKALALDTKIPTPDGFKEMRDIKPGDYVFDEQGVKCRVIAESEIFTNRKCYKITFRSGASVVCDAEHEWIFNFKKKSIKLTTEEAFRTYKIRDPYSVNLTKPIKNYRKDLLIPPYTLGFWLGDGHSDSARITLNKKDVEVLDFIQNEGVCVTKNKDYNENTSSYSLTDGVKGKHDSLTIQIRLKELGLINNKHIPNQYLWSSYQDRLELLRGLMDSDGCCLNRGDCEFASTNETLANDVALLLRSLGIKAKAKRYKSHVKGYEAKDRYRVYFFPDKLNPVFKLKRKYQKQVSYKPISRVFRDYIESIKEVPSVPTKCIQVSSKSSLYLCTEYFLPTHNSTLVSALVPFCLDPAGDGEGGAQAYLAATAKDQAGIIYREAANMIDASPELLKKFKVYRGSKTITYDNSTFARALSAEASSSEGLNAHLLAIDEIHAWSDLDFYASIKWATAAREQPLTFIISTAGADFNTLGGEEYLYTKKLIKGDVIDVATHALIFEADPTDDLEDEKIWYKANPSLGHAIPFDRFKEDFNEAKQKGGKDWADFKRYRFNIWGGADAPYLNLTDWNKCGQSFDEKILEGRDCFLGIDLSSKEDITAICYGFKIDDLYYLKWRYWCPQETIKAKVEKGEFNYQRWRDQGYIIEIPGARIDQDYIERKIREDAKIYNIKEVIFDPWNAYNLVKIFKDENAFPVLEVRTSYAHFSIPTKELKSLVSDGKIKHNANPVTDWMAGNLRVQENNWQEVMPAKKMGKMKYKIDGMVAGIMSLMRLIVPEDKPQKSRYEDDNENIVIIKGQ